MTYTATNNVTYRVVYEDNSFIKETAKKRFLEVEEGDDEYTYVYLTGETYQFAGYGISGHDGYAQLTAYDTFKPVTPGTFTMTLTQGTYDAGEGKFTATPNGQVLTQKVKIVYSVDTMMMGSDFESMLTASSATGAFQTANNSASYVMEVGLNNYVPDVSIKNDANMNITFEEANIMLSIKKGTSDLDEDLASRTGNRFDFDSSLINETLTVTMQSKYDYKVTPTTLSLSIKLNNGVNVYTNEELRANYKDLNVHKINVLRNIKAKLAAADYVSGYGESYGNVTLKREGKADEIMYNVNLGTPVNDFAHSVYARTCGPNDSIVINGNFFEIDGSSLPYIDNAHDRYGSHGSENTITDGIYRVANVQIGIFLYRCADLYADGDMIRRYASGNATINNLRINGNNLYDQSGTVDSDPSEDDDRKWIKMSQAYLGIILRGGTLNVNNVSIRNTGMGFMVHGSVSGYNRPGISSDSAVIGQVQANETQATKLYANGLIVDNSWANSIYCYDLSYVDLKNTKLGKSCGAAFHVDDKPYGGNAENSNGYSNLNTELKMDIYTSLNVENWIVGDEAWFTAYGFATVAVQTKEKIEGIYEEEDYVNEGVKQLTQGAMTILKHARVGDQVVSMMNFAFLSRPVQTTDVSAWSGDKDHGAALDVSVVGGGFSWFYSGNAEMATVGGAVSDFTNDLTAYGTALAYYQGTNNDSYLETAMEKYNKLIAGGRPYTKQSASGMTVIIPAYYAHERAFDLAE